MSCGGRVYKGDTVTISVPFDVSGYTDLTISYSTTGDSKIVKGEDEVTIEDGFISYTFSGDELDLLPDGVIYYTINYEVDGTDYVASTNTNLYLKTPAGYSGKTADDIWQSGYTAGLEACSGDCESAIEQAKAEQAAIDEAKLTGEIIRQDGVYVAPYGYKQVIVEVGQWKWLSISFVYDSLYNFTARGVKNLVLNGNTEIYNSSIGQTGTWDEGWCTIRVKTQIDWVNSVSFDMAIERGGEFITEVNKAMFGYGIPDIQTISAETTSSEVEYISGGTLPYADGEIEVDWYSVAFTFPAYYVVDNWQLAYIQGWGEGFQAGLAACQSGTPIDNVITVWNNYSEANSGPWMFSTIRDLMIDGAASPYQYEKDSVFGKTVQFNLQSLSQIPMPSSLTFTVDSYLVETAPDVTRVKVFGQEISNFSVVKTPTTPIDEGNIGTTYEITMV